MIMIDSLNYYDLVNYNYDYTITIIIIMILIHPHYCNQSFKYKNTLITGSNDIDF